MSWVKEMPEKEGLYAFRCSETDQEIEYVGVFLSEGELTAKIELYENGIDLATFHHNSTYPQWLIMEGFSNKEYKVVRHMEEACKRERRKLLLRRTLKNLH